MDTQTLAMLIGVGSTFLIGLIKRFYPLGENESYGLLFALCLVGAIGSILVQNQFKVSEVLFNFPIVLTSSQLVYSIAFKYFGLGKLIEGSK